MEAPYGYGRALRAVTRSARALRVGVRVRPTVGEGHDVVQLRRLGVGGATQALGCRVPADLARPAIALEYDVRIDSLYVTQARAPLGLVYPRVALIETLGRAEETPLVPVFRDEREPAVFARARTAIAQVLRSDSLTRSSPPHRLSAGIGARTGLRVLGPPGGLTLAARDSRQGGQPQRPPCRTAVCYGLAGAPNRAEFGRLVLVEVGATRRDLGPAYAASAHGGHGDRPHAAIPPHSRHACSMRTTVSALCSHDAPACRPFRTPSRLVLSA
jgi:hypothetical protein